MTMKTKMTYTALATGLSMALTAYSGTASADPVHTFGTSNVSAVVSATVVNQYDPIDPAFRLDHPFRVFIDVAEPNSPQGRRGRGRGRGNDRHVQSGADHALRSNVAAYLPAYIQIVPDRRAADMIVHAEELDRQLTFRVADEDQRRKKYSKRRRYTGGECGQFHRAFYSRIKEQGIELADYRLSVRLRGQGRYSDTVRIESRESYRYGANLRASTNCGVIPTRHFPNSAVAELFSRNPETYRPLIAREVARETAGKLAHIVADMVTARSEQFYAGLAAQYSGAGRYYASNTRGFGDVYDYEPATPRVRLPGHHDD